MLSFHQFYNFFLKMSLTTILIISLAFSFSSEKNWATMPIKQLIGQQSTQIANTNQVESMTTNIEGKAQEKMDNLTSDRRDQVAEKTKQVELQARNSVEDAKDNLRVFLN